MLAAQKRIASERRWVCGLQNMVLFCVDQVAFALRELAPKQENEPFVVLAQFADDHLCEICPADVLVRIGQSRSDGQHRIDEQNTLLRPLCQVAVKRAAVTGDIGREFFVDFCQRSRDVHVFRDAERKPHCLPRTVIGVLPEDDHFYLFKRGDIERIENQWPRGIDDLALMFFLDEV